MVIDFCKSRLPNPFYRNKSLGETENVLRNGDRCSEMVDAETLIGELMQMDSFNTHWKYIIIYLEP